MVVFNYSGAELNAKVVYYGPALSGKTTNLEFIYERMPDDTKGKMVSMKTRTDRTLFFDFLPLDVGEINGYRTRILLYTVPGQVYYNATRKLVLKGADAVVFVADSQASKLQENIDSLRNLEENLNEHGLTLDTMPWAIQYNKRDLPDTLPVETLNSKLNLLNVPSYEAVATTGAGIYETFRAIAGLLYRQLVERLKNSQPAPRTGAGVAPPPQAAANHEPVPQAPEPRPVAPQGTMPQVQESRRAAEQPRASHVPSQTQPTGAQKSESQPWASQESPPQPEQTAESRPWAPQEPSPQPIGAQTPESQPRVSQEAPQPPVSQSSEKHDTGPPQRPASRPAEFRPAASQAGLEPSGTGSDYVSEVVDSALREVGVDNAPTPDRSMAATSAPPKPEPARRAARPQPLETGPDTERRLEESPDKEFQFAPLESSQDVDEDVGRVIDFEETPVEEAADSQNGEFIVDPFRSKKAEPEQPEFEETPSLPPATASPPAAQPPPLPSHDDDSVTVTVPVYLKRSQLRKTVAIKIELEIQVGDEEAQSQ
jgi:signal recognition particle receptor subunit beta